MVALACALARGRVRREFGAGRRSPILRIPGPAEPADHSLMRARIGRNCPVAVRPQRKIKARYRPGFILERARISASQKGLASPPHRRRDIGRLRGLRVCWNFRAPVIFCFAGRLWPHQAHIRPVSTTEPIGRGYPQKPNLSLRSAASSVSCGDQAHPAPACRWEVLPGSVVRIGQTFPVLGGASIRSGGVPDKTKSALIVEPDRNFHGGFSGRWG